MRSHHVALFQLLALAAILALPHATQADDQATPQKLWVYIGTYTGSGSAGIYRSELDLATGQLSAPELAAAIKDPSFLAIHPNRRFLYAVNEVGEFGGKPAGAVSAFAIDAQSGKLSLLNQESSGGPGPCHVVVDKQGKHVLAANYSGGSAVVLPIKDDGRVGPATAFVQHQGSSVDKSRQEGPHAHSINLDAANRYAFVADLGLDKVLVYRFDADRGTLTPNEPPAANVAPGAGPRHFAFHPDGRHAYVINEMQSTITAFSYDPDHGVLKSIQTISALPAGFQGQSWTAEVQVHPSGKFVYGSNRGQDSIAIFRVDPETGKLTPVGHQGHHVKVPRNFALDPTGRYLLVASQDGDRVVVFRIDLESGNLTPTGSEITVSRPVCLRMLPRP